MNDSDYNLKNLLAGYFHQDWRADYGSAPQALEQYLSESSLDEIKSAHDELRTLLLRSDQDVIACVVAMGCYYYPVGNGSSYRDWLKGVMLRLKQHVESA